ncbi:hypothetical protein A0256_13895 [Mucilaginibacter sp. PAMC 26640]|nr:hypothetical protein A0256_13895 [Mucilaginibacter sp. PAMC 26640]
MPKLYRTLLFLLLQVIILVSSYFIGKRAFYYESGMLANRRDVLPQQPGYFTYMINLKELNEDQVKLFKLMPHDTADIVFVGTSLTQGFPLQEMFGNIHLKNRGIGGNSINDIKQRIDEVILSQPKKIFLEVGINDIGKTTVHSVYKNFTELVNYIKLKSPKTKLYVNSVLPFGKGNLVNIKAYNALVIKFCANQNLTFINLFPLYVGTDGLKPDLTTDGTHLKAAGYVIWKNYILQYITN